MILIPLLNNAVVFNGDFLLVQTSDDATNPSICHVHNALHPDWIIVKWWIILEDVSRR